MVYRTIIHLNIELQIPVIYRADFGLRGFTPFNLVTSIKSFGFSTLYTTISHQKLKSRLATIIRN